MNKIKLKVAGLLVAGSIATVAGTPAMGNGGSTFVYGNVSSWVIRTDESQSYRCFAEVAYEGGTSIRIGYNIESARLYLTVADPAWSGLRVGTEHPDVITFDDGEPLELTGSGVAQAAGGVAVHVTIPPASSKAFLDAFGARHTLGVAVNDGAAIELSLAGSYRAVRMLEDCQTTMARHAP
jgi:hypothetical protein